jgi:hypothetical protein
LALVDLLGADNLPERCLELVAKFRRRRALLPEARSDVAALREEIPKFCVRRTRRELNEIAGASPEKYLLPSQRYARYPTHRARFYERPASSGDLELAREIDRRAAQLLGTSRIGKVLEITLGLNLPDGRYLSQVCASGKALARYHVLKCMRSSRAALLAHLHGTAHAIGAEGSLTASAKRSHTGNIIATVHRLAGQVPEWKLKAPRESFEPWLWDPAAHREASAREVALPARCSAGTLIGQFVDRLRGLEPELLRALLLLERCLTVWTEDAAREMDHERVRLLRGIRSFVFPGFEQMGEPFADPRSVADAWLRILRPRIRDALAARTRRRRPWRLDDLEPSLREDPIRVGN